MSKSIIFDTETTGTNIEDRIIQVGAIVIDPHDREYKEVYDELCSSDIPIKIGAMAVHGIRQIDIDEKPAFLQGQFIAALNRHNIPENYLIAHNINFDLDMLVKEGFENKMQLIDTLQCAKHLYEIGEEIHGYILPNHKLQTFRYILFGHEDEQREADKYAVQIKAHDAIGDVIILKLFFREIYKRVMQKFHLKSYSDIMAKMVELTTLPVEIKIINFGKHNGKTLQEIEQIDSGWIDWLYREQKKQCESQDPKCNKDLFYTLDKIVQSRI